MCLTDLQMSHSCLSVPLLLCADQVLEKAMHKCVLKPLKSIIEAALHDFQVSNKRSLCHQNHVSP